MGLRHLAWPDDPMSPALRSEVTTWDEACEACAAKILGVETVAEVRAALDAPHGGAVHPCAKCGVMRTEAEGGTTFTVCDECWDARHGAPRGGGEAVAWRIADRNGRTWKASHERTLLDRERDSLNSEKGRAHYLACGPYCVAPLYAAQEPPRA